MKYIEIDAVNKNQKTNFDLVTYNGKKYLRLSLYSPVYYMVILISTNPIYTDESEGRGDYFYVIRLSEDMGVLENYFSIYKDSGIFQTNGKIKLRDFAEYALSSIKEDIWRTVSKLQEVQNKFLYSTIDISKIDVDNTPIDINGRNLTAYCMESVQDIENNKDDKLYKLYHSHDLTIY